MRTHDDEGSVLLLTLGLFVIGLLLVAVVVDVSAVALAQRSVSSAADGAALAAAQQPDPGRVATQGLGRELPLDDAAVARAVAAYAADARDQPGLRLSVRVVGGDEAVVVASRTVRLPFGAWFGVRSWQVRAEARARSRVLR